MKIQRILLGALTLAFCFGSVAFAEKISAEEGKAKVAKGALLVDVRSVEEFSSGHVAGAINIPHDAVKNRFKEFGDNPEREVVLYCRSGRRSGVALEELEKNGFKHVFNAGGYSDWSESTTASQ